MSGQATSSRKPAVGPLLVCQPIEPFDATEHAAVRASFQSAPGCEMQQAWQAAPSEYFAPAVVRVGWRRNALLVYAELADADIITQATGLNQRLWELGDSFEMFLRPEGREAYVELQVAPNNHRLQLRYADRAALERARQSGSTAEALIPGEAFRSAVWVESSRWCVLAEIPAALVCGPRDSLAGQQWHFSFSRYDYTRGRGEPVISCTSPHTCADFHRQAEWGIIRFGSDGGANE